MDAGQPETDPGGRYQVSGRPCEGRNDVDRGKARNPHACHPGNPGDDGLYAGHEAAEEDALAAMAVKEGLTLVDQRSVALEGPEAAKAISVVMADPVGQRVARDRAGGRNAENGQERQLARADHRAGGDEHDGARHEETDDEERLSHTDEEQEDVGQHEVLIDEVQKRLGHRGLEAGDMIAMPYGPKLRAGCLELYGSV